MLATLGRFVMAGALAGALALWSNAAFAQEVSTEAQAESAASASTAMLPSGFEVGMSATQASTSVRPSSGVSTMTSRLPNSLGGATTGVGIGDSSSPIQSRICQFDRGPRTGQRQDSLVLHPLGTPCGDGTSSGHIVAP